ncbi:MAG: DUF3820 family protein [Dehalococcoidales bacterium]|nr:DUF3820 family protein [Dehalococcoidales bacterium]
MKFNAGGDNINPGVLSELVSIRMPFGKYQGRLLCDLPVTYLEWFSRKGFPPGKIGAQLSAIYEIKLNGLEYLLNPLKHNAH